MASKSHQVYMPRVQSRDDLWSRYWLVSKIQKEYIFEINERDLGNPFFLSISDRKV